eukprot:c25537_g1_i1.p2 GENE.c25537_g1_i1~~c25537_g1_i1.p2  ORF type:complete len:175 (-),score=36.45 c25537_g1_i1:23-514(-)
MNTLVAALVLLALASAVVAQVPTCASNPLPNDWGFCDAGSSTDDLQLTSVTVSPSNGVVVRGNNISMTVEGSDIAGYAITGGTLTIKMKYGIITVLSKTYPLCTLLENSPYPCPVEPFGSRSVSVSEQVPSNAPAGTYTGSVIAEDQENNEILNIDFELQVSA